MKCDFSGYATKNDLKCADGRVIRHGAFKENDGKRVPLVWNHLHDDPVNILGHAVLENREDGVYTYGFFNDSEQGKMAKTLVEHGDIESLSIYANKLVQKGSDVLHGVIREVSLVLAGANPGARIENLSLEHSDGSVETADEDAYIYSGSSIMFDDSSVDIEHSDEEDSIQHANSENNQNGSEEDVADNDRTIEDVINSMTDEQKNVVYYLVGQALEDAEAEETDEGTEMAQGAFEEGDDFMKHNVFDGSINENDEALIHDVMSAIEDAKQNGDMRSSFIAHSIENIDVLFPEAKLVTPTPEMIARPNDWVTEIWSGLKKSPFARIKSTAANITADEARAKGYIKGKQKKEEVVKMLKRVTTPQTVYKLQKMDRDDVIDITDIDVVAWLKAEMRIMLDEEIARAVLVGDGRDESSDDKINEVNIRPIYQDADTYTIHYTVDMSATDPDERSRTLVDSAVRARKDYMGSGNPAMIASVDVINDMLLARDKVGRRMYGTMTELASALRVSKIIETPILEGVKRTSGSGSTAKDHELLALIVNLNDYTLGADKGGEVNMFDDFNIDFNKYEYLIETRVSGALTKPYSAIALEKDVKSSTTTTTPAG